MSNERCNTRDSADATVVRGGGHAESSEVHGHYVVECFDKDGNLKWRDTIENLVTTVGKNDMLDKYLGNSAGGTVRMGLKGSGSAVAGDTQASHAGWNEVGLANAPTYSGNRPSPTFGSAGSGTKSTSSAVSFSITSSGTVAGCFINVGGSATIDNTTGVLFSAGDFAGGSKTVANLDTINVSYSASLT